MRGKRKAPRTSKPRNVMIDTNVISSAIGDKRNLQKKAIRKASTTDHHIYTKTIDDELGRFNKNKKANKRIERFRNNHRKSMITVDKPTDEELKKIPVMGNDRRILSDANKTKTNIIVTLDKKFQKKGNGYKGISVIEPVKYAPNAKMKEKYKSKTKRR